MRRVWWMVVAGGLAAALLAAVFWLGHDPNPTPPPEPAAPAWFADVTAVVGLDFRHDAGAPGSFFMPQALGSGVALFDFNNDERLDILLLNNGGPQSQALNRLYRQTPTGAFVDATEGSGLGYAAHCMGAAVGDVNNDGWLDLLITEYTGIRLFINQGDGQTFRDVTADAALVNPAWAASAAFFDYDRDGWLDLVVANYVDYDPSWPCTTRSGAPDYCPPQTFPGRVTTLFRNRTAESSGKVLFEEVTVPAGLGTTPGPGLGVVCFDADGDGWQDIFIANDGKANRLWINQRNGTFVDEAITRGVAYNIMGKAEAGMGVALGDADGDGLLDLFVTHLTEETNTFWRQAPRGFFRDQTARRQVAKAAWRGTGFGAVFGDFECDGDLDLAFVNGRVAKAPANEHPALGAHWGWYGERNQLLANDGSGVFSDVSGGNAPFCGTANVARGLAMGDLDNDGGLDLVVTTVAGPARVYRNVAEHRGNWLIVRALDPRLGRDALGAEIRLRANGQSWVRPVQPACSYLSSSDLRVHFGVGDVDTFDRIEVLWPDGTQESFPGGGVNRTVILRRGGS